MTLSFKANVVFLSIITVVAAIIIITVSLLLLLSTGMKWR